MKRFNTAIYYGIFHPHVTPIFAVARRDTADSDSFKAFFLGKFADKAEQLEGFDWDAW